MNALLSVRVPQSSVERILASADGNGLLWTTSDAVLDAKEVSLCELLGAIRIVLENWPLNSAAALKSCIDKIAPHTEVAPSMQVMQLLAGWRDILRPVAIAEESFKVLLAQRGAAQAISTWVPFVPSLKLLLCYADANPKLAEVSTWLRAQGWKGIVSAAERRDMAGAAVVAGLAGIDDDGSITLNTHRQVA